MLMAVAAALWGSDALFRRGLALELPSSTVVVYEHALLVVLTLFPCWCGRCVAWVGTRLETGRRCS